MLGVPLGGEPLGGEPFSGESARRGVAGPAFGLLPQPATATIRASIVRARTGCLGIINSYCQSRQHGVGALSPIKIRVRGDRLRNGGERYERECGWPGYGSGVALGTPGP
jgi:hypothetical protein